MTGKKVAVLERPDDDARHLASLLTLEEQVSQLCLLLVIDVDRSRSPYSLVQIFGGPSRYHQGVSRR